MLFCDRKVSIHDLAHALFDRCEDLIVDRMGHSDEHPLVQSILDIDENLFSENIVYSLDEDQDKAVLVNLPGFLISEIQEFYMRIVGKRMREGSVCIIQF